MAGSLYRVGVAYRNGVKAVQHMKREEFVKVLTTEVSHPTSRFVATSRLPMVDITKIVIDAHVRALLAHVMTLVVPEEWETVAERTEELMKVTMAKYKLKYPDLKREKLCTSILE